MNDTLLSLQSITKRFKTGEKSLTVLEDLSLSIYRGSSLAIIGKSGSGKTTLLNIAGGLDTPDSGNVIYHTTSLAGMSDRELSRYRNANIGFIFQTHILLEDFTALENVMMPSLIRGDASRVMKKRAQALLERVGLSERMSHHPGKLSGGERQRVALCRALINDPDIIIADEPTGSLDEQSSAEVETLLFDLVREENRTLLLVTHDPTLAHRCTEVYQLQNRGIEKEL